MNEFLNCLGLMSGTSADGIDLSIINTDGTSVKSVIANTSYSYTGEQKQIIKSAYGKNPNPDNLKKAGDIITQTHSDLIQKFIDETEIKIDLIGFHGQTTYHEPQKGITTQIGDPQAIADKFNIPVVGDFRSNDMAGGGNGAPLIPVYHQAMAKSHNIDNVCFVNLGGIANITICNGDNLIAFDTGTANCLIDDYCQEVLNIEFDNNGELAKSGNIVNELVDEFLKNSYFTLNFPKSLDRNEFKIDFSKSPWDEMNKQNALATLTEYTVQSIALAIKQANTDPQKLIICGGGANNNYMVERLCQITDIPRAEIEIDTDYIESQGFAFMASRTLYNMPISFPTTTGVKSDCVGGVVFKPQT